MTVPQYIANNPVEDGLVSTPREYPRLDGADEIAAGLVDAEFASMR